MKKMKTKNLVVILFIGVIVYLVYQVQYFKQQGVRLNVDVNGNLNELGYGTSSGFVDSILNWLHANH